MIKHTFETQLIHKEQLFNILALGHATGFPILFIGPHGTAKTRSVLDYMSGFDNAKTFKLELSEGTRISELTGHLDYNKLVNDKTEEYVSPIADADAVLINEVDKGNSAVRNALLGIMAEKMIMRGNNLNQIPLKYRLFAGSCNFVNQDQDEAAFWDRFVLKYNINRISESQLSHSKGRLTTISLSYNIPNVTEIKAVRDVIPDGLLERFFQTFYHVYSDRTLFKVPDMIAAYHLIHNVQLSQATLQIAEMMDPTLVMKLSQTISKEPKDIYMNQVNDICKNTDVQIAIEQLKMYRNTLSKMKITDDIRESVGNYIDLKLSEINTSLFNF